MTRPSIVCLAFSVFVLAAASAAQAQAPQPDPKSPQYRATGEQDRTYTFPGSTESIPYHIYVPTMWNASKKLPLVVVTHGANQPATAPFQRPMSDPTLAKAAEARGLIVRAVAGVGGDTCRESAAARAVPASDVGSDLSQSCRSPRLHRRCRDGVSRERD